MVRNIANISIVTSLAPPRLSFTSPETDATKDLQQKMNPGIRTGMLPPFHELDEYVFQDICRDLFLQERSIATCEVYGGRGQSHIDEVVEHARRFLKAHEPIKV